MSHMAEVEPQGNEIDQMYTSRCGILGERHALECGDSRGNVCSQNGVVCQAQGGRGWCE